MTTMITRGLPTPVAPQHDRILALVRHRHDLVLTASAAAEGEFDFDLWADLRSPTGARRRAILDVTSRAAELGLIERPVDVLDEFVRAVDDDWRLVLGWAEAFRAARLDHVAAPYERAGIDGQALSRRMGELISAAADQAAIVMRSGTEVGETTLIELYALHRLIHDGYDLLEAYAGVLNEFRTALDEAIRSEG